MSAGGGVGVVKDQIQAMMSYPYGLLGCHGLTDYIDIVLFDAMTLLSSTDFELTVVPSDGITAFGAVDGDLFLDDSFSIHYRLTDSVSQEMGLRFGAGAGEFVDDHLSWSGTHCLRVQRINGVHVDDHGRTPGELLRAIVYGFGGDPSPEAITALEHVSRTPDKRFHSVKFGHRIGDKTEGTDRFVYRKLVLLPTDTEKTSVDNPADSGE